MSSDEESLDVTSEDIEGLDGKRSCKTHKQITSPLEGSMWHHHWRTSI